VRDCGVRGRIKVISINKGMKKSHIGRSERKKSGKLMNSEKNEISKPNDENRVKKSNIVIVITNRHYRPHIIYFM